MAQGIRDVSFTIVVYDYQDAHHALPDWRADGRFDTLLDVARHMFPNLTVDGIGGQKVEDDLSGDPPAGGRIGRVSDER